MDSSGLKKWKEEHLALAERRVAKRPRGVAELRNAYKRGSKGYKYEEPYTTSLEPHAPLWAQLPFFKRVNVSISPHLRSPEEFQECYGVSPPDMLALYREGRVNLRILFPASLTETPDYLDEFLLEGFPTTCINRVLDQRVLGKERMELAFNRFNQIIRDQPPTHALDQSAGYFNRTGPRERNVKAAWACYAQLLAMGKTDHIRRFEGTYAADPRAALDWLSMCRLFEVGPVHYSLGGIHSVSDRVPLLSPPPASEGVVFPSEIGRILVEATGLVNRRVQFADFTLRDSLDVYEDYEEARRVLMALDSAIKSGRESRSLDAAEDLLELLAELRASHGNWLRLFRIAASTGAGIAALPLGPIQGLLVGLGFTVAAESRWKPIDRVAEPIVRGLEALRFRSAPHLNLLLRLDENVRAAYKGP